MVGPIQEKFAKAICQISTRSIISHSSSQFSNISSKLQRFNDHHSVVSTIAKNSKNCVSNKENISVDIDCNKLDLDNFINDVEKCKAKPSSLIKNIKRKDIKKNNSVLIPESL